MLMCVGMRVEVMRGLLRLSGQGGGGGGGGEESWRWPGLGMVQWVV